MPASGERRSAWLQRALDQMGEPAFQARPGRCLDEMLRPLASAAGDERRLTMWYLCRRQIDLGLSAASLSRCKRRWSLRRSIPSAFLN